MRMAHLCARLSEMQNVLRQYSQPEEEGSGAETVHRILPDLTKQYRITDESSKYSVKSGVKKHKDGV